MSKKFIDLECLKAYHDENVKALNNKADKKKIEELEKEIANKANEDHTHEGMVTKDDNGNIKMDHCSGMECITSESNRSIIGFNEEGCPTILNPDGRYIQIATKSLDDDYLIYNFPEHNGEVVVKNQYGDIDLNQGSVICNYIAVEEELFVGPNDDIAINSNNEQTSIGIDGGTGHITLNAPKDENGDSATIVVSDSSGNYNSTIAPGNIFLSAESGGYFEASPEDGYVMLYNQNYSTRINFNEIYTGDNNSCYCDINPNGGFIEISESNGNYSGLRPDRIYHFNSETGHEYNYTFPDQSGTLVVKNENGDVVIYDGDIHVYRGDINAVGGKVEAYDEDNLTYTRLTPSSLVYSPDDGDTRFNYTFPEQSGTLVVKNENNIINADTIEISNSLSFVGESPWMGGLSELYIGPNDEVCIDSSGITVHDNRVATKDENDNIVIEGFIDVSGVYSGEFITCNGNISANNGEIEAYDGDNLIYARLTPNSLVYSPDDGDTRFNYSFPTTSGTLLVVDENGDISSGTNNFLVNTELSVGGCDDVIIDASGISLNGDDTGITLDGIKLDSVSKLDDYDTASESQIATTAVVAKMIQNSGQGSGVSGDYLPIEGGTITGDLEVAGGIGTNYMHVEGELGMGDADQIMLWVQEDQGGESRGYFGLNGTTIANIGTSTSHGVSDTELVTSKAVDAMIPDYYMHTISIDDSTSTTKYHMALTILSKSPTAFTAASIYNTYGSKAFECSGYYGSDGMIKIAFTSTTSARFVYGPNATTKVVTISSLSDTVIPV